jgi:hypothetical protein
VVEVLGDGLFHQQIRRDLPFGGGFPQPLVQRGGKPHGGGPPFPVYLRPSHTPERTTDATVSGG